MNKSTEADRDVTKRNEGYFEGMLTDEERESFQRCVEDHYARRSYEGAGGFMGLAKVRIN